MQSYKLYLFLNRLSVLYFVPQVSLPNYYFNYCYFQYRLYWRVQNSLIARNNVGDTCFHVKTV